MAESKITSAQLEMIFSRRFRDNMAVHVASTNVVINLFLFPKDEEIDRAKSKRDAMFSVVVGFQPFPSKSDFQGYSDYFGQADLVRENGNLKYLSLAQVVEMLVRSGVAFNQVNISISGTKAMSVRYSASRQAAAVKKFEDSSPSKIEIEKQAIIDYLQTLKPGSLLIQKLNDRLLVCEKLIEMDSKIRGWTA